MVQQIMVNTPLPLWHILIMEPKLHYIDIQVGNQREQENKYGDRDCHTCTLI